MYMYMTLFHDLNMFVIREFLPRPSLSWEETAGCVTNPNIDWLIHLVAGASMYGVVLRLGSAVCCTCSFLSKKGSTVFTRRTSSFLFCARTLSSATAAVGGVAGGGNDSAE